MLRKAKVLTVLLIGALAMEQAASAFTMEGPIEGWQTAAMDYPGNIFQDYITVGLQLGGTKNLGEEYRLNTPVITYAYDQAFLDYFGTAGVKAVDSAFAFMNKVPAVSKMSKDLSEFLTQGNTRINQRAQALFLVDMKSAMIQLLVEHMGLGGETHIFDLSYRNCIVCSCAYGVIIRNFDPITWEPTRYVNGAMWTYQIQDYCPVSPPYPNTGGAVEQAVDSTHGFSAVATPYTLRYGTYYLSLTRDDMGGLRYLYRANNYNPEPLPVGAAGSATAPNGSQWGIPSFWGTNSTAATGGNNGNTTAGALGNTNVIALRGGIEKVSYVKMHYDSLIGTTFQPVRINYTIPVLAGSKVVQQSVTRVVTAPDILITAANFEVDTIYGSTSANNNNAGTVVSTGSSSPVGGGLVIYRTISYASGVTNTAGVGGNITGGGAAGTIGGPGIINPQMQVIFNKTGPAYSADNIFFYTEETALQTTPLWGVFDGSTNAPIVFPSGKSIRDMEAQVLIDPGQNSDIGTPNRWSPIVVTGQPGNGNNNNNGQTGP